MPSGRVCRRRMSRRPSARALPSRVGPSRKQEPDSRANHPAKKKQTRTAPPAATPEKTTTSVAAPAVAAAAESPVHGHWRWRGSRCSHWFWRAAACCSSCPGSDSGKRGPDGSAIAASTPSRGPRRSRARQLGDGGPARSSGPGLLARARPTAAPGIRRMSPCSGAGLPPASPPVAAARRRLRATRVAPP